MNTISDEWEVFANIAKMDSDPVHVSNMNLSFYAGANALLVIIIKTYADNLSDDSKLGILMGLHKEIQLYIRNKVIEDAKRNQHGLKSH